MPLCFPSYVNTLSMQKFPVETLHQRVSPINLHKLGQTQATFTSVQTSSPQNINIITLSGRQLNKKIPALWSKGICFFKWEYEPTERKNRTYYRFDLIFPQEKQSNAMPIHLLNQAWRLVVISNRIHPFDSIHTSAKCRQVTELSTQHYHKNQLHFFTYHSRHILGAIYQ